LRYVRILPRMLWSDVSRAVVAEVAPVAGEHVVDLGAGMGPASVAAARSGAHVLAVDPTPFMRRMLGARRLLQRTRRRITVLDGAAEALPAADGSIDAVWSVNTMHHWGRLDAAIGEIGRVLRPGGRLLLVDEDFDDPAHPAHERHARRARHAHEFDDVDPAVVAERCLAAGFASATGAVELIAGRPAKVVRAVRG
jgi:SAM-dependent methyltransferase